MVTDSVPTGTRTVNPEGGTESHFGRDASQSPPPTSQVTSPPTCTPSTATQHIQLIDDDLHWPMVITRNSPSKATESHVKQSHPMQFPGTAKVGPFVGRSTGGFVSIVEGVVGARVAEADGTGVGEPGDGALPVGDKVNGTLLIGGETIGNPGPATGARKT
jgi:hypothetical protein